MITIGELATTHPVEVLTTTRVSDAARFMADFGIGDVIVADPDSGQVVGMLTDRDIAIRLVARNLDAPGTEVGTICSREVMTIKAAEPASSAMALMSEQVIRRLPVIDEAGKPVGIVSVENLAASGCFTDTELSDLMRRFASTYRRRRVNPTR